jgi:Cu/Ag efflux protein CusF
MKGGERIMLKRMGIAFAVIAVSLSLAGLAVAAVKQVSGEVVTVNPDLKTIVIRAQGQDWSFSVGPKLAETLSSFKPGDKVTVHYTDSGGKLTAQTIKKG